MQDAQQNKFRGLGAGALRAIADDHGHVHQFGLFCHRDQRRAHHRTEHIAVLRTQCQSLIEARGVAHQKGQRPFEIGLLVLRQSHAEVGAMTQKRCVFK